MSQIALVSYEHDDDVGIRMVSQLLQPPRHSLISLVLADIVDEQGAHCSSVVGGCDGAVSLLAGGIPDLCLDRLRIYLDTPSRKLHADGRLGVEVELVAGEPAQQIGLTDAGVSDQHHWEGGHVSSELVEAVGCCHAHP